MLSAHGAQLAFTYQSEAFGKRVRPLALSLDSDFVLQAEVACEASLDSLFAELSDRWGRLDFLVHAIAFSDKEELKGKYLETTRGNFARTLEISCYSFTDLCRRAAPLMTGGGSLLTLTYSGAERVSGCRRSDTWSFAATAGSTDQIHRREQEMLRAGRRIHRPVRGDCPTAVPSV